MAKDKVLDKTISYLLLDNIDTVIKLFLDDLNRRNDINWKSYKTHLILCTLIFIDDKDTCKDARKNISIVYDKIKDKCKTDAFGTAYEKRVCELFLRMMHAYVHQDHTAYSLAKEYVHYFSRTQSMKKHIEYTYSPFIFTPMKTYYRQDDMRYKLVDILTLLYPFVIVEDELSKNTKSKIKKPFKTNKEYTKRLVTMQLIFNNTTAIDYDNILLKQACASALAIASQYKNAQPCDIIMTLEANEELAQWVLEYIDCKNANKNKMTLSILPDIYERTIQSWVFARELTQ